MGAVASPNKDAYYVPAGSNWPMVAVLGIALTMTGLASWANGSSIGMIMFYAGIGVNIVMMIGWFRELIRENMAGGAYGAQMDRSYRMAMGWFIFSELMFFAAFFGALYYARSFIYQDLSGRDAETVLNNWQVTILDPWTAWSGPAKVGGDFRAMGWFGLPLINTLILLTSGLTCTYAHHAILEKNQRKTVIGLSLTVALGIIFLACQAYEYMHAYDVSMNLKLSSGIYGSTFYLLTGFHGLHVTLGTIMLACVLLRAAKGHYFQGKDEANPFSFESAAWYWHFVDVVWLGLFIFVYIV